MKRAKCPVCGSSAAVKTDGTLVQHGRKRETPESKPTGEQCSGTGQKP